MKLHDKPPESRHNEAERAGNYYSAVSLSMADDRPKSEELHAEQLLIERSVRGESSAFGQLYDRYLPKIYRFIFFKVGHREEAEDLTHQVFLSAWENISSFRQQGLPLSSWLYKIARNRVIDHYRTKRTHVPLETDGDFEHIPEDISRLAEGMDDLEKKLLLERIYTSLHKLTDEQQEIIVLRFIEELSNKEIARALEKNEVAIRVLQHRALKNLKKIIEEYEG